MQLQPVKHVGSGHHRTSRNRVTTIGARTRPTAAAHGAIWIMLMQRTTFADWRGQTSDAASRAIAGRMLWSPRAADQASILARAAGSGSLGWNMRPGLLLAKCEMCSPVPLATSRTRPREGRWR